jgi:hypothetical protein
MLPGHCRVHTLVESVALALKLWLTAPDEGLRGQLQALAYLPFDPQHRIAAVPRQCLKHAEQPASEEDAF